MTIRLKWVAGIETRWLWHAEAALVAAAVMMSGSRLARGGRRSGTGERQDFCGPQLGAHLVGPALSARNFLPHLRAGCDSCPNPSLKTRRCGSFHARPQQFRSPTPAGESARAAEALVL